MFLSKYYFAQILIEKLQNNPLFAKKFFGGDEIASKILVQKLVEFDSIS